MKRLASAGTVALQFAVCIDGANQDNTPRTYKGDVNAGSPRARMIGVESRDVPNAPVCIAHHTAGRKDPQSRMMLVLAVPIRSGLRAIRADPRLLLGSKANPSLGRL